MLLKKFARPKFLLLWLLSYATLAGSHDQLLEAARKGNVAYVLYHVKKRPQDVNYRDEAGTTPLHAALQCGHAELADILVEIGAPVNSKRLYDETPLHLAARYGFESTVRLLKENGARLDAKDKGYNTALHEAVRGEFQPIVDFLLDHPVKFDAENRRGETPLAIAVTTGNERIVARLIKKGADVNFVDAYGDTLLHDAIKRGYERVASLLIASRRVRLNEKDVQGATPLYLALESGMTRMMRLLLEAGADTRTGDEDKDLYMHEAVRLGNEIAIKLLAHYGASLDALNSQGQAPIHLAVLRSETTCVKTLLKRGAFIDALDGRKRTPLLLAVLKSGEPLVRYLVNKGACLDFKDDAGLVPLQHAVLLAQQTEEGNRSESGDDGGGVNHDIARFLLEMGAEIPPNTSKDIMRIVYPMAYLKFDSKSATSLDFDAFILHLAKGHLAATNHITCESSLMRTLLETYASASMFGLYRLAKAAKGEMSVTLFGYKRRRELARRGSVLEERKFSILTGIREKITFRTYGQTLHPELLAFIMLEARPTWWVVERVSFHLAFASIKLNVDVTQARILVRESVAQGILLIR